MQVFVRDNDVDYALRQLKRKLRREGLFRELKRRRAYEKPSEGAGPGSKIEVDAQARKALRKRLEREGYQTLSGPILTQLSVRARPYFELPFGPPPDLPRSRWSRGESHQSH